MQERMKNWRRVLILTVVCVLSVAVMLYTLTRPQDTFVPPPFENAAVDGTPQSLPDALGYTALDASAYRLALCGAPVVKECRVQLYFTNPEGNSVWLKVRVYASDGTLLGESGLLKPGQYVESVALNPVPVQNIPVALKVMAYEPDTYQSAGAVTLNTTLTVK